MILSSGSWRDWVADPNVLRYCTCQHAEQLHRPACTVTRCDCDRFNERPPR